MWARVAETTCDLILSCPRYKHLASNRLAHDQRQPETNDCSARDEDSGGEMLTEEEDALRKDLKRGV